MLLEITTHLKKLSIEYPLIRFIMFEDCSGYFGYLDRDGMEELESFDSYAELETILGIKAQID